MFKDIDVAEWNELRRHKELSLIDVRSEGEYEDTTVPGSFNIPIFTNAERAEIGTLFKQVSVQAAKERGLEIVSAKMPAFIRAFAAIPGQKVVFCWRGGMRSKTTATLLSLMDIRVFRLTGGYRAYRQWVVEQLQSLEFAPVPYVIQGPTGSGKTAILQRMKDLGHPVIDLEGMAGHRGSIFGGIGMKAHNQKTFDGLLVEQLLALRQKPYVLFEAESRRIGKIVVPDIVMAKRAESRTIRLELPIEARVQQILADYKPWDNPEACIKAFRHIRPRIHTPIAAEIDSCLQKELYEPAVELLLKFYYDPRYAHSSESLDANTNTPEYVIRAESVEEAAGMLHQYLLEI